MNKSEIKNYLETADNIKEAMEYLALEEGRKGAIKAKLHALQMLLI